MAEVLKRQAWLPNRGGTYRTADVLGPYPFGAGHSCWRAYTCCCVTLHCPQPVGCSMVLMTPPALGCYQEAFRRLALSFVVYRFLRCKAEGARQAAN